MVFQGIMALEKGGFEFISFLGAARKAVEMGYVEAATWIEENIETYARGLERGFESE